MQLGDHKVVKANRMYCRIKYFIETQPELLEKTNLRKCESCDGTGLEGYGKTRNGDYMWIPGNYCDECRGIGFKNLESLINVQKDEITFLCTKCYGMGCERCDDSGFVDWITHAKGAD